MDDKKFDRKAADDWIKIIEHPNAKLRENDIYPFLKNWLGSSPNVLDIGCGQGVCSSCVGESNYVGIDASADLINRAKGRCPERNFIEANLYEIPFGDQTFAAAFSIAVWHLLGDLKKASGELARVLTGQGKFLIVTADPDQYQNWTACYTEQNFEGNKLTGKSSGLEDTLYLYKLNEIIDALENVGLAVLDKRVIRSFIVLAGSKRPLKAPV